MKKRILSFMTILILCLGLAVPAFAEETEGFANEYPRVIDNAELLSADQYAAEGRCDGCHNRYTGWTDGI